MLNVKPSPNFANNFKSEQHSTTPGPIDHFPLAPLGGLSSGVDRLIKESL